MRYKVEPIGTRVYSPASAFAPEDGSVYISGYSHEVRSKASEGWIKDRKDVRMLLISDEGSQACIVMEGDEPKPVLLRSDISIRSVLALDRADTCYLDITGLPHHVWAPILKSLRGLRQRIFAVYYEPGDYKPGKTATDSVIFDLSERIAGISPIPGLATLAANESVDDIFVPLLGFEGARLSYIMEAEQPNKDKIFPVVGVPGFRPEYPFHTYICNKNPLLETRAWSNIRLARANCPFSVYQVLERLAEEHRGRIKIAPIGTKPHGLGAVLFFLDHSDRSEILYDHPKRSPERTTGTGNACVYDLSFLD